jgi:hypothetical protein
MQVQEGNKYNEAFAAASSRITTVCLASPIRARLKLLTTFKLRRHI